ncbi:MAG: tRNA (guanosine(46)-N7)-methyltransferase TrmB, partial [Usitatibacter sp.]
MNHPPIRSYVLRQGRYSPAQQRAFAELMPRFGISWRAEPLDFASVFGREAPVVAEVGFGMGETTARIAADNPDKDYLAIEVHSPGVGSLLKQVEAAGLSNVRIVQHDAAEVMRDMIAPGSLAAIHVFFPDPWPKKRHWKRRFINQANLDRVFRVLVPEGEFRFATDVESYAEWAREELARHRELTLASD